MSGTNGKPKVGSEGALTVVGEGELFDYTERGWTLVERFSITEPMVDQYGSIVVDTSYSDSGMVHGSRHHKVKKARFLLRADPDSAQSKVAFERDTAREDAKLAQDSVKDAHAQIEKLTKAVGEANARADESERDRESYRTRWREAFEKNQKLETGLGNAQADLDKVREVLGTERLREILAEATDLKK